MFRTIYEILTARKYRYIDPEIGLLKRVGGYWRVEEPKKTLGVSIKITGSDRFGPNRDALSKYKELRPEIESIWQQAISSIIAETCDEQGKAKFKESEFVLNEIIFGQPGRNGAEFAYAFNITSAPNEYGACIHNGKYSHYYSLY
jgi:hypothetical protein